MLLTWFVLSWLVLGSSDLRAEELQPGDAVAARTTPQPQTAVESESPAEPATPVEPATPAEPQTASETPDAAPLPLSIWPESFHLRGDLASQQLLLTRHEAQRDFDVTREVTYSSTEPRIARVTESGVVRPVGDGQTTIVAQLGLLRVETIVTVQQATVALPLDFEYRVQPILTAYSCNSGACHGKQRGQNGFQLSLLGFDADFDYQALVMEGRGRRIFPAAPERSLMLLKASGSVPHGGGTRLDDTGDDYRLIQRWIAAGMPRSTPETPTIERVTIYPDNRVMRFEESQQLAVTAHYSDGTRRDVTAHASFQSNESPIAAVDPNGLIHTSTIAGEASIMARYMSQIAIHDVSIPYEGQVDESVYAALPRHNFIDDLMWQKLQRLQLTPSEAAPDHVFLRRVYVDVIGRLPTSDESRTFLADDTPDKRLRLIDTLLESPEYADHWANKWVDLLRPNPYRVGIKAVLNFDAWIRDSFRKNKPYDQFVRELVSAQGSTWRNGAATLFRDRRAADELSTMVSQLFLGIRLECAKCHHHPFEAWAQDDFYGFAAYFSRIGRKGTGLSPPISGSEEIVFTADKGSVTHPLTGKVMEPSPLFGEAPLPATGSAETPSDVDPREVLADWITSPENPFFEQVMANRVWADLMGRGLVDPVDDLRATNPPTNAALLQALGADFREHGYDLKHLIRTIALSYAYGLSSLPNERNTGDTRYYSRYLRQRLRAEVLLDSVCGVTGVGERFQAMPPDSRANQLWTHRIDSLFLDTFGRPDRNQDPPSERTTDASVVQALHLMNSPALHKKVTDDAGRAAQLAASDRPVEEIVEELYLSIYCRYPDPEEMDLARSLFETQEVSRRQATEDLMWALLNTPEFVFKN